MHGRSLIFTILSFILWLPAGAAPDGYTYDYTANCDKAYQQYLSLHIKDAKAYISNELKANPNNLMAAYLADYEDCIELLLNCDKATYELRGDNMDKRLQMLDRGDKASPWFRLCKAGVYLHWAIINVRFGEQYKAAFNFRHSFALLNENQRIFPSFEYNNVFAGLEESVVGSLPGTYKLVASVFGMKGSIKRGTDKLAAFCNTHHSGQPLYNETLLFYLYTRFYLLSEQQEVWNFLNSSQFTIHNNLLNVFVKANIALDFRKADEAMQTLQAGTADVNYYNYPVFDYQMGAARLTKLDTTATSYFMRYLDRNKSDLYVKDTWQKMAFVWYANNNLPKANYCLMQAKAQGSTKIDADKQANRFAQSNTWPPVSLVQARLLIEGGYYDRALALLQSINPASLSELAARSEYYFRLGRVYEELGAANSAQYYKLAFTQYRLAMTAGKGRHEQFAARAALHMGKVYEKLDMKPEAATQYRECLDMPAHDFQNSIDQQAKAGINRVEGR